MARAVDGGDRLLGQPALDPEAELRVDLPGLYIGVGRRGDPRGQPDQHVAVAVGEPVGAGDLVERVDDDAADPGLERHPQLGRGLVVAVHVDPRRIEAGPERHVELAAGCDVDAEPLLAADPVDGGERRGLARVEDLEVDPASAQRGRVGAGAGADVVGRVDVGGGAELAGHVDEVAAADDDVPLGVDRAPERICRGSGHGIAGRCRAAAGHRAILTRSPATRVGGGAAGNSRSSRSSRRPRGPSLLDVAAADGAAVARHGDRPRRRVGQGEPRRLRAAVCGERLGRRQLRPARSRRERRRDGPRRPRRRRPDGRSARRRRRGRRRLRLRARLEHGRLAGDRSGGRRPGDRRGDRDLPGLRGRSAARHSRRPLRHARGRAGARRLAR